MRLPAVAGMFYPDDPQRCAATARSMMTASSELSGISTACGAMVPHAGWMCSGAIAGQAIATLAQFAAPEVDLVIVFGAVHTAIDVEYAALDSHKVWRMPGNDWSLASDLTRSLLNAGQYFAVDERLHRNEHAVEVELPFVQSAWPKASLLPIEVPLIDGAEIVGQITAERVAEAGLKAVYLASSDMTHYGPAYQFTPAGIGLEGLAWARENDWQLLRLMTDARPERIVREVRTHRNACGGGAIAAMLAACETVGASAVRVLQHANSFQTLATVAPAASNRRRGIRGRRRLGYPRERLATWIA